MHKEHDYHIVDPSPWPIATSFSLLIFAIGAIMWMHHYPFSRFVTASGACLLFYSLYSWWMDVISEGKESHTQIVKIGLKIGMALFIITEIMFFGSIFWAYFHSAISSINMNPDNIWDVSKMEWPPHNIETLDPYDLPLLNTFILLLSSTTLEWATYSLKAENYKDMKSAILYTTILGVIFTILQAVEYHHASFKISDGIYPSIFFIATGFHGLHVIIGTIFLFVCYTRALNGGFSSKHNIGFQFASWYWHFVDIVWVLLYIFYLFMVISEMSVRSNKLKILYIFFSLVCIALAIWQYNRLQWKLNLIEQVKNGLESGVTKIDYPITPKNLYHHVSLNGKMINSKTIFLYSPPRIPKGEHGYRVFVPFEYNGNYIIVDKGWVSASQRHILSPNDIICTIDGYIIMGDKKSAFTPNNDIKKNLWFWIDIKSMQEIFNIENYGDFYVMLSENCSSHLEDRAKLYGRNLTHKIRNHHSIYMYTWLSLAAISFLYYIYNNNSKNL